MATNVDSGCLWTIDYNGSLYKLDLEGLEYICTAPYDPNSRANSSFKRISSVLTCAWAVGGDQNVYMMVRETDLPITAQEHCYENERWGLRFGWSQRSMFVSTDRWAWSSKNGKKERRKESFYVPNACWEWEGDWFVDQSIECDVEGWQYALDFPARYYSFPGKTSFVRRRKWSKYRKFVDFNQWLLIATVNSEDPFHDIAVGGDNIPGQTTGFLAVWGVTFAGKVFFRTGISRTCPEGEDWVLVNCDDLNLVQISVSSTGLFCGCTWDGQVAIREGVNHINVIGTSWRIQEAPTASPLTQLSVGTNALWALDFDDKLYFYRCLQSSSNNKNDKEKDNSAWVEMVGTFDLISVAPNDQVFALSNTDRCMYMRTDVRKDELVGRTWKFIDVQSQMNMTSHCICIDSGSCVIDSKMVEATGRHRKQNQLYMTTNFDVFEWRNDILKNLCERNKKESENNDNESLTGIIEESNWNKRCKCKFLVDKYYDLWSDSHLKLTRSVEDDAQPILCVYYSMKSVFHEWVLPLERITSLHRLKHSTRAYTFTIISCETDANKIKQEIVLDMGDEKNIKEWITVLRPSVDSIPSEPNIYLWATSALGEIFQCSVLYESFAELRLSDFHWTHVDGHLKQVVCNSHGFTWGFGYDGNAYTYLPNSQHTMESKNIEEHTIYENQRWNPVEGFTSRLLPSDRWAWSDKPGYINCAKDKYLLPSTQHRWIEDWRIFYDPEDSDKDGWQYAIDFPRWYHKHKGINDYVRRRRWKRKCQVTTKSKWMEIKSDVKILDFSFSMETNNYALWAVSCNGDVLYRKGIVTSLPQGKSWLPILVNSPMTSISVGVKSRVWCVARDGSCYMRAGFKKNSDIGTHWFHIPKGTTPVKHISVGTKLVLALNDEGAVFYRCDVNDAYPEGTRWQEIWQDVDSISVNMQDEVTFIKNGNIVVCVDVLKDPTACTVAELLLDGWSSSCCRGIVPNTILQNAAKEDPVKNITHFDSEVDDGEDCPVQVVNPYSVDIYSFYGQENSDEMNT